MEMRLRFYFMAPLLTPLKALLSYSVKKEATLKLNQLTMMALILLASLTVVAAHTQQGQLGWNR